MSELYELPNGWEWRTFNEELILIQNGLSDKQNDDEIGYPISRIETVQNETLDSNRIKYVDIDDNSIIEKYRYDYGDLLFSHINSFEKVGKVCLYTNQIENLLHGVNLLRMKFTDRVDSKFVFYFLISNVSRRFYEPHIKKAINQASINQKNLKTIPLPLPPLPEQQRIVSKLDLLFEKIDKSIALHQKNMDEANVFMGSILNDVFGELEEKYGKTPIFDVMKISNKTLVPNDNEEYNYVGLENIESNSGKLIEFSPTIGSEIKSSKVFFKNGMVLYGKLRPYLNKVWIANFDGVATTEILPFYPIDDNELNMEYVKHYFLSPIYLNKVMNNCSGARMPRLTSSFLKSDEAYIPIPSISIQQKVVSYLDDISKKIEKIKQAQKAKMDSLKALKASILDQAFKGEL